MNLKKFFLINSIRKVVKSVFIRIFDKSRIPNGFQKKNLLKNYGYSYR